MRASILKHIPCPTSSDDCEFTIGELMGLNNDTPTTYNRDGKKVQYPSKFYRVDCINCDSAFMIEDRDDVVYFTYFSTSDIDSEEMYSAHKNEILKTVRDYEPDDLRERILYNKKILIRALR